MIKEIVQFVDTLPPETFSKNLQLKEGLYMFLEKQNDKLLIDESSVLRVYKDSEHNYLYNEFLARYNLSKMITGKSMNSSEKIFIDIGTPFGISISGKGIKPDTKKNETLLQKRRKQNHAVSAYFKAIQNYIENNDEGRFFINNYLKGLKTFVENDLLTFFRKKGELIFDKNENKWEFTLEYDEKQIKIKDDFVFYFFLKEPSLADFKRFHDKYLEKKVFLYDLKNNETRGICNELTTGNITKKPFMRHKTASFSINYKVDGPVAKKIYQFFNLKNNNKILPNPCPVFIDKEELNSEIVKFQKDNKPLPYKELIKSLLSKYKLESLQSYYLIFFQRGLKKTQIVDIDFIPIFKYRMDQQIHNVFQLKDKNKNILPNWKIKNVFELEQTLSKHIFYQISTKSGAIFGMLNSHYFSEKIEPPKGWIIPDIILNLTYKYRKAIYDYIYKSRHESVTCSMYDRMMTVSILEDIRIDEEFKRSYSIKEKLNLWFSLYTYFSQNQNRKNMINKTLEVRERLLSIIENENEHINNDDEFAFAIGQLIWKILIKNESSNRTHALLEPFLQKTDAQLLKHEIAKAYDKYKHAFTMYPQKYGFDKIMGEVMGITPDEKNMKKLLPMILAGYFYSSLL